ncbi:MAG TPA: glycoside hydrolase family 2 TIM barrel-domain containing protein [Desulfobacterales bacterium]
MDSSFPADLAPEAAARQTPASATEAGSMVEMRRVGESFQLYRNNEPYYIKGVGGSRRLASAAAAGANSVRTWSAQSAGSVLDRADELGMTVLLGVWLSHAASDYGDADYRSRKIAAVEELVDRWRNHPALLMWALGNEINLEGADTPEAWLFVEDLARRIKARDVRHPVITVISFSYNTVANIVRFAPSIDALGINAYGAIAEVRAMIDASAFTGPYLISEWGVDGHWEVEQTPWGRPIEPTSAVKAASYLRRYSLHITANSDRCLGSYVFLWGQKQERTPTWYSMFTGDLPGVELGAAPTATVDVMRYNWSGAWPENRAPAVNDLRINGLSARDGVTVPAGEEMIAEVEAVDPEAAPLDYVWEVLQEPSELGSGGSYESRPSTVSGSLARGAAPVRRITAPDADGAYRLFVYVQDDHGRVGTANVPFRVVATSRGTLQAMRSP